MSTSPAPAAEAGVPTFAELAADPEIAPLLTFQPVVRKVRRPDGWTPELQRELIARIAATGTVQAAVWQMGKHATGAEALYKTPGASSFRTSWDAAIIIGRRRNGLDSAPPFAGEVPGITRRRKAGPAEPQPDPDADPEPLLLGDEEKWDLIVSIATKFMRKVAAERAARLAGEVVAADFYLRQVTIIEVLFDLTAEGFGFDPNEVLRDLRRGGHGLIQIVSTDFTDALDDSRRLWWAREGEPERPSHPDVGFLQHHRSGDGGYATYADQHGTGPASTPARGYSEEEWAAMPEQDQLAARRKQFEEDAQEQHEWEASAHRDYQARRASDAPS